MEVRTRFVSLRCVDSAGLTTRECLSKILLRGALIASNDRFGTGQSAKIAQDAQVDVVINLARHVRAPAAVWSLPETCLVSEPRPFLRTGLFSVGALQLGATENATNTCRDCQSSLSASRAASDSAGLKGSEVLALALNGISRGLINTGL